jgi:DNA-binding helix-hairpin-helix protein with protein kinase domain
VTGFTTSSGRRVQLGKVIGKGGEGTIFHVEGDNSVAVKIYTDGKELELASDRAQCLRERLGKVNAMIADRLHERLPFVAFPIETVNANGAFAGFTMRKVVGAKPMHQLCTPGDRKTEFPEVNFRSLVRVALNFTRAVASINNLGAGSGLQELEWSQRSASLSLMRRPVHVVMPRRGGARSRPSISRGAIIRPKFSWRQ